MRQNFILNQKLTTNLQLSQTMKKSLDVLKMDQNEVLDYITNIVSKNPVISFTPSADMHEVLMETASQEKKLVDELYLQLHTSNISYNETIASFLIESLDEHGFFTGDIQEYANLLHTTVEEIQYHLSLLQTFEPIGVAAKSSKDSIRIQLKHKGYDMAARIFSNYEQELIKKDYLHIAKQLQLSVENVIYYIKQIQECSPFPCSAYDQTTNPIIIPDFEVKVQGQEIEIIPKQIGHFQIADELTIMKEENSTVKAYFDDAYFFIDHLNKRNKTLLLMANELFHIQKNHFLFQDELQSCTLLDIAQRLGFHESTVSRTLSNKYYVFENEIYPVKDLFISTTKEGSSKDAILKAIQKFIMKEDKKNPYTDQELVDQLESLELYVSRRGVAKYRNELQILGSKERKKMYKYK